MRRFIGTAAILLLAIAVRALGWPLVLQSDRIVPFGNDAYYHLRRILYSLAEFPAVLEFDPYLNFPEGAKPIWTPVFDWLVAAAALPFADPAVPESLWRFAIWVPPILGAGTVLLLMALVRRHCGAAEAWLAGVLLALSSGHFWYSQIGFVDHHAAVALVATGAVFAAMNLVADLEAARPPWRASAITGALLAGALLVWPGSLLHVGAIELGLLVFLLTRIQRPRARTTAAALAVTQAVAFACVLPLCWNADWPQWGAFSPVVLTGFQPWLFASLAAVTAGCTAAWRGDAAGATSVRRAVSGAGIALAVVAVSGLFVPELLAGAEDAWLWFARRESFQSTVAESWPLFVDPDGRFELGVAARRLSGFVFAAPLAIAWLAWKRRDSPPILLFLAWSTILLLATLAQRRFFNTSAIGISAVFGITLISTWRELPARWRRERRGAALAGFAVAIALLLAPSISGYRMFLVNQVRALRGARLEIPPELAGARIALESATWMSIATPETAGWLDPTARPEYGVLAPWSLGHILETVGRRPTVVTNFGDDIGAANFERMQQYYRGRESEGAEILEKLGVRYVVAQRGHRFLGEEQPAQGSLFHSLWFLDGSRADGDGKSSVPALARHRMVHESQPLDPGGNFTPAYYKVFEFVPGAEIVGRGRSGERVEARLELRSNWRREFEFATGTTVGRDGSWRLRVPYATRGGPPSVEALGPYTLACGGDRTKLHLDEADVQSAAAVMARDACPAR